MILIRLGFLIRVGVILTLLEELVHPKIQEWQEYESAPGFLATNHRADYLCAHNRLDEWYSDLSGYQDLIRGKVLEFPPVVSHERALSRQLHSLSLGSSHFHFNREGFI